MRWYTGNTFYDTLLLVGFAFAAIILLTSFMGTAKYGGRFGVKGKGFKLGSKIGWIVMELPGLLVFPIIFFMGKNALQPVPLFFLAIWIMHYSNRALITPMLMRVQPGTQSSFDISVVLLGWVSLTLHGYFNAAYISELGTHYVPAWFSDPRFLIGLAIYLFGFTLNVRSDSTLRNLRSKNPSPDEPRYKIPYGGGFKFVTCPQYLGEITSFIGIAVMTWNLGALFVLAITIANLVPRALYTHRWFHKNFDDYPKERKAVIPYLL
ncbi:MAG: 3-oxo-5-alpha-steroid 4-dehydrogenase [Gammaproteobacteria bacterium]|nr:3-oxo-5-alpha-steroid 4-dehydrogenase [Gammaproteobacteria bacterium]